MIDAWMHQLFHLARRHRSRLIHIAVVGAILCALPGIGWLTDRLSWRTTPLLLPVVLLVAPLGMLAVANCMELGIAAMLLAAVFVRFRLPTGTASEIVISLMICMGCIALWILNMVVERKRIHLKPAPVNLPIVGFVTTVAFSWLWAHAFRDPLVIEIGHPLVAVTAGLVIALLPSALLMVANNVKSIRWLQALVWILLGQGLLILIIDIGCAFEIGPLLTLNRFLATNGLIYVNSHGLISMWCISFALALALFHRGLRWEWRALLLLYTAGWVYWGFVLRTSWLAGWVPAFFAAALVTWKRSKKLFLLLILVAVVIAGRYYWENALQAETQESGFTRLAAWEVNWRVTGKHMLFGTGPAGYASYYMSYYPTEAMATHNNFIDLLAQVGLVGTTFYLWLLGAQFFGTNRLIRKLRGTGDFAESLLVAVLAGTAGCGVAMMLGDWLTPFAYTQGIIGFDLAMINWLFMGTAWALQHILDTQNPSPAARRGSMAVPERSTR